MAWYTIEHACGHVVERQFTRALDQREATAEHLARQPCPECRRRNRAMAKSLAIDAAEAAGDWPPLLGGEREVALARRIRFEAAEEVRVWEHGVDPERATLVVPLLLGALTRRDSADWWLDRRGADWSQTLRGELTDGERERVESWGA